MPTETETLRQSYTPIHAPRGNTLACKGWQQEAAMRMLMNNLDEEVGERPQDLVVYGGPGQAGRRWDCYRALVRGLKALENHETLLGQWRQPVAAFKTHENRPPGLIANPERRGLRAYSEGAEDRRMRCCRGDVGRSAAHAEKCRPKKGKRFGWAGRQVRGHYSRACRTRRSARHAHRSDLGARSAERICAEWHDV